MTEPTRLPTDAFHFRAATPSLQAAEGEQSAPRRFSGTAYSGEVIRGHWHWGDVVFDLDSMHVPERLAALIEHDRAQRAGVVTGHQLSHESGLTVEGHLLRNPHGAAVAQDYDDGFPWEMSVHIDPGSIEELASGAKTTVNGREIAGPATVFRNSRIREVSFTPTGYDPNTAAHAMQAGGRSQPPKENAMSPEELQARVTELEGQLAEERQAREAAEQTLRQSARQAREAEVRQLFADLGRDYTDEAAAPYVAMDAAAFAAVAKDMRAAVEARKLDPALFSEQATGGADHADRQAVVDRLASY